MSASFPGLLSLTVMSSDAPTSRTVTASVELGSTKTRVTSFRCSTCRLSVRSPDVMSLVGKDHV